MNCHKCEASPESRPARQKQSKSQSLPAVALELLLCDAYAARAALARFCYTQISPCCISGDGAQGDVIIKLGEYDYIQPYTEGGESV